MPGRRPRDDRRIPPSAATPLARVTSADRLRLGKLRLWLVRAALGPDVCKVLPHQREHQDRNDNCGSAHPVRDGYAERLVNLLGRSRRR